MELGMGLQVNDANFSSEVLGASEPVLVDFWAEWCPPCKAMDPIMDQLSVELAGKVKIVKLDVETNPATVVHYNVRAMPTLMVFKDGAAGGHEGGRRPVARAADQMARRRSPEPRHSGGMNFDHLAKAPFDLNRDALAWVEATFNRLSTGRATAPAVQPLDRPDRNAGAGRSRAAVSPRRDHTRPRSRTSLPSARCSLRSTPSRRSRCWFRPISKAAA